jgi:hypothetical protein
MKMRIIGNFVCNWRYFQYFRFDTFVHEIADFIFLGKNFNAESRQSSSILQKRDQSWWLELSRFMSEAGAEYLQQIGIACAKLEKEFVNVGINHHRCKRFLHRANGAFSLVSNKDLYKLDPNGVKYLALNEIKNVIERAIGVFSKYSQTGRALALNVIVEGADEKTLSNLNENLMNSLQTVVHLKSRLIAEQLKEDLQDFNKDVADLEQRKDTILNCLNSDVHFEFREKQFLDTLQIQRNKKVLGIRTAEIRLNYRIPLEDLEIQALIGAGDCGKVYRVVYNAECCAFKKLNSTFYPAEVIESFYHEIHTMKEMHHENLVCFRGVVEETDTVGAVLEYLERGSLKKLIQSENQFSGKYIKSVAKDIASALSFLHLRDILHRNLKPTNVLFDRDYRAKVSDFGMVKIRNTSTSRVQIFDRDTFLYLAPEKSGFSGITVKESDVFSFGMLLYAMLIWDEPLKDMAYSDIPHFLKGGQRPKIPDEDFGLKGLIERSWTTNYQERPQFNTLVYELSKMMAPESKMSVKGQQDVESASKHSSISLSEFAVNPEGNQRLRINSLEFHEKINISEQEVIFL